MEYNFYLREALLNKISMFFRFLPHFRGKLRLGKLIGSCLTWRYSNWGFPEYFIELKSGLKIKIDVRSLTHQMVLWTGLYDTFLIQRFIKVLNEDCIILDVGANIGYYSIQLGKGIERLNGKLFSFEPVKNNYNALVDSIKENNLQLTINAYNLALGEKKEKLYISMTEKGKTGNAFILNQSNLRNNDNINVEEIEAVSLDEFSYEKQIEKCDLIKIDIEGAEIFFIRGGKEFIKKTKPVIYGEFNRYFMKNFNVKLEEAYTFLQSIGYECYVQKNFLDNKETFTKLTTINEDTDNLLFLPIEMDEQKKNIIIGS